jgi:hypothetical protein
MDSAFVSAGFIGGSEWDLVPVGAGCPRSDILLLARHPRRLSRTIRTPMRTIFIGHFSLQRAVGARIEQIRQQAFHVHAERIEDASAYTSPLPVPKAR